jgi:hypothetical protein
MAYTTTQRSFVKEVRQSGYEVARFKEYEDALAYYEIEKEHLNLRVFRIGSHDERLYGSIVHSVM